MALFTCQNVILAILRLDSKPVHLQTSRRVEEPILQPNISFVQALVLQQPSFKADRQTKLYIILS